MGATTLVLEVNRRRYAARERVFDALKAVAAGGDWTDAWPAILALERAAIACGVARERRRQENARKVGR